jgi:hypothetical protein
MDDPRTPGERAADEWAVRNVISKLALYADGVGTLEEYAALFTEDGEWLMPTGPIQGRDNILAGARARREAGGVGPDSHSRHMITSVAVDFEGPDVAVADAYFLYVANTDETPQIQLVGYYHDTLRRTSEGWQMARREITFG